MLALIIILAVATLPAHTRGGDGYPCWWEEGHWVNQVYGDKYGNYTSVAEWVQGRWVCWY